MDGVIGGICGYNCGVIKECVNEVNLGGGVHNGGICGETDQNSIIEHCTNSGKVAGLQMLGGIVGLNRRKS